ncbi:TRAP transporter small permease [Alloalcanivorax xenomutans]|jgi:TRAP-type C4-dicarboxylate transport system permease small subunit|uniref:TRAP transporter small permease n=1 Tax=Alloalcanivorax xenomutans TaxID=1094342 RepID=UPI0003B88325|nr:TRAP transporter small permease [Alloalcanivorax xenomutans]ERS14364.1 C4-dicarboxylate ABC transporter substrate-binding protein [Alcanivorax sp. PN-3]KYZ85532.1 C4-dicarboxylate ABC transporter substrate-binding protein [Alcanivorax sp. KX64203]MBA4721842.1 TRAP transporter small permease [Alcanivorax sp.]PHS72539.1 MAG: TRAP transporter small permease [Alcanivorax sp.]WOD28214.1 TRAP transporter small permease [Alloalcanivorax xenomutans]
MYALGRWLSKITNLMTVIGGLAIALMMLHVTFDVIGRYVFGTPIPGTITIVSHYYMIVAAFVPLAYAEQKNAHITVEVVTERLPQIVQKHLEGWALAFSGVVFSFLTVRTWGEALSKHAINASVVQGDASIAVWQTYFVLPVGIGLMTLVLFYKFIVYLFGLKSGLDDERAQPDEMPIASSHHSDAN